MGGVARERDTVKNAKERGIEIGDKERQRDSERPRQGPGERERER